MSGGENLRPLMVIMVLFALFANVIAAAVIVPGCHAHGCCKRSAACHVSSPAPPQTLAPLPAAPTVPVIGIAARYNSSEFVLPKPLDAKIPIRDRQALLSVFLI